MRTKHGFEGVMIDGFRYVILIQFKGKYDYVDAWDIRTPVKTLREAQQYKVVVDESVKRAQVYDTVTKKVVEKWV